jgi:hypothetical protein
MLTGLKANMPECSDERQVMKSAPPALHATEVEAHIAFPVKNRTFTRPQTAFRD